MLDFSAYLAAQHLTRDAVNDTLRDAPERPARVPVARRGVVSARQWLTLALRRVSDVMPPLGERAGSPLPAVR